MSIEESSISKCPYHRMLNAMKDTWNIRKKLSNLLDRPTKNITKENWEEIDPTIKLFKQWNLDSIVRIPNRPLWELSDTIFKEEIVVEEWLKLLDNFKHDEFEKLNLDDKILWLFDLKILYMKMIYQDVALFSETEWYDYQKFLKELRKLISKLNIVLEMKDNAVPTYNDLIFTNPKEDIRTFCSGETWLQEYYFYLWHALIENEFEDILNEVESMMRNLKKDWIIDNFDDMKSHIDLKFKNIHSYMRQYNKYFKREYFDEIRKYFSIPSLQIWSHQNQDNKGTAQIEIQDYEEDNNGPSWVNMWSIIILNQLIQWDHVKNTTYMDSFWDQDKRVHPKKDQHRFTEIRKDWVSSLHQLAKENDSDELYKLCGILNKWILEFLLIHLGSVKKFLPEAYKEWWIWTWWYAIKESLMHSINNKIDFKSLLTKE